MAKHLEGNISFWPRHCERQLLTNATEVITSQHSPRLIGVVTAYSTDLPIGPIYKLCVTIAKVLFGVYGCPG